MYFEEFSLQGPRKRGRKKVLTDSVVKRRKAERGKQTIYIGDEIDRWMEVKEELNLSKHSDVARVLLDRYCDTGPVESQKSITHTSVVSSTPATNTLSFPDPWILEISSTESVPSSSHVLSGVEEIERKGDTGPSSSSQQCKIEKRQTRKRKSKTLSSSFEDPFILTIDVSEEYE